MSETATENLRPNKFQFAVYRYLINQLSVVNLLSLSITFSCISGDNYAGTNIILGRAISCYSIKAKSGVGLDTDNTWSQKESRLRLWKWKYGSLST